jgi:hypothetical protein
MTREGRILEIPGYDVGSRLLLDFLPGVYPAVPTTPTMTDVRAALECFEQPLRGFPFVDEAARSVALSAMLSALVRHALRTVPLHAVDAPAAGTGKSLLAELVGLLAMGHKPAALSQGKTAEEDEKRLATVLFEGDPIIHIDNCKQVITGDFLCSMLTQEVLQARILGKSERRVLYPTALVLVSGNNLSLAGDVSRRAVICRMDARVERPDTRSFEFDCHAEVLAARPRLVTAGLTILRGYQLACQHGERVPLVPMGSFDDWAWVRGTLVWLGRPDPADTRAAVLAGDPRRDDLLNVMELWERALGRERVEVGEIARRAALAAFRSTSAADRPVIVDLRDKLIEVSSSADWNGRKIGWWLRGHIDRVVQGRAFRCDGRSSTQRWWLAIDARERG